MDIAERLDVIVVGGGHAGTEAALAAARGGARTLLLTQNLDTIGQMSCNPAIGGIGKGHLVREIDALGGAMAWAADQAGIQFRILNRSKGPAVRATRAQADRVLYRRAIRQAVERQDRLRVFQQGVDDLIVHGDTVRGVVTELGLRLEAPTVILTVGTFLAGKIHVGPARHSGGRAGDAPSVRLAGRLRELPFRVGRLKTGTPPRIDGRSIDYGALSIQPGDDPVPVFSFLGRPTEHPRQVPCHITRTNPRTHELIRGALDRSPLFSGVIEGVGPRYCPSIEDKVVRFADRDSHQIFLEPEGLDSYEIYPNGISTSLPFDVQQALVRSIDGLAGAHLTRPGYAIEYDFFDPRDLSPDLQTRFIHGLYFAGQINGTTGYEEAAAQGLLAGINAARSTRDLEPWSPGRDQAYLGVLVDDLITRGTSEPYRMFTSRAEHRLILREDNADLRLTPIGRELGLVEDRRWRAFEAKRRAIEAERVRLRETRFLPGRAAPDSSLPPALRQLSRAYTLEELLRRPDVDYETLMDLPESGPGVSDRAVRQQLEIEAKYSGYIARQHHEIERSRRYEQTAVPEGLDFREVPGLSNEVRQRLGETRPQTVGQASRIPGVTPAAISILLVYLKKLRNHPAPPGSRTATMSSRKC